MQGLAKQWRFLATVVVAALAFQPVFAACCGAVAQAGNAEQAGHAADCPTIETITLSAFAPDESGPAETNSGVSVPADHQCQHALSSLCAEAAVAEPALSANAGSGQADLQPGDPVWSAVAGWLRKPALSPPGSGYSIVFSGGAGTRLLRNTQRLRL